VKLGRGGSDETKSTAAAIVEKHGPQALSQAGKIHFRTAHEVAPDDIDVTTVSLDDPAEFPPRDHTWTSDALPWLHDLDALPRFPKRRSGSGE
jgi:hypothetical protein